MNLKLWAIISGCIMMLGVASHFLLSKDWIIICFGTGWLVLFITTNIYLDRLPKLKRER